MYKRQALYDRTKAKFDEAEFVVVEPVMLSEDFSNFQRQIPGLCTFMGIAEAEDAEPLHSSTVSYTHLAWDRERVKPAPSPVA